ncbi:junctional adhesion molecule-like [Neoarius graeffei]|uniref:junctional adhesion molecule-like n=1 Tax=Neoarius graeffei TaxID=443677 RepID=UPI00298CD9A5|nr:junctional adhesion molecule-like [Neoarius graeffei]
MVKVTDTLEPGPSSSHDAAREEARDIQIEEEVKDDSASSDSSTDDEEETVKSKEQCEMEMRDISGTESHTLLSEPDDLLSVDPGLWPAKLSVSDRAIIVRKLATREDKEMSKDSEGKPFPDYLRHRMAEKREHGCALSGDNKQTEITRHKGGSVLLPCSCSDLNTKPQKVTWETSRTGRLTEMLNDEHYRGRFKLFNNISPANLSLLLSDLREEDGGVYRCSTGLQEHRDIRLYIKGCELVKAGLEAVTGFTGESVVLPCVCTDLQDKPKSVKWAFRRESGTNYQEIYPEQTGHHRNRVKLVSKNPPGNLSLLIPDLTEEDQGEYRCSAQTDHRYFRLSVKGTFVH